MSQYNRNLIRSFVGIVLFALPFFLLNAQTLSDAIHVGSGGVPDLDIDPATGNLHIVHHFGGVKYTMMNANGDILIQETVSGSNSDNDANGWRFGATVAFDPTTNQPHVVYRDNTHDDFYDLYYTKRRSDGSWTTGDRFVHDSRRAYAVRMDVDSQGRAHIVHGSGDPAGGVNGPASYLIIKADGFVEKRHSGLDKYRTDDRVEIAVAPNDDIHFVLSSPHDYHDVNRGGAITYYRSLDGGASLRTSGDIHDDMATQRNGNADIFVDNAGNVHIAYGSQRDRDLNNNHSVRYARFENGQKIRDVPVNSAGELSDWHHGLGIGSVAASPDGNLILMTYKLTDTGGVRYRVSTNGGASWSDPEGVGGGNATAEGRNKQVVRSWKNHFFLLYPNGGSVSLRKISFGDAPDAVAGGPYSDSEGAPILFDASGSSDADGSITTYRWDWDGDGTVDDETTEPTIVHIYNDDFSGEAILRVVDNDGFEGQTTFQVDISNVNPVVNAGGPYAAVVNAEITLFATVTDSGSEDTHEFSWDLDGDGIFEKTGQEITATFSISGENIIKVKATDDDGGFSVDETVVNAGGGAPVLSAIPGQTIQENGHFSTINLKEFSADANHTDDQLTWSYFGNTHIQVSITDGIASLHVALADSEWAGQEEISFIVTDPDGKSDTTSTSFAISPVNDAPQIMTISNQSVWEGVAFNPIILSNFVTDPDNDPLDMNWEITANADLSIAIDNMVATIAPADSEWAGAALVKFMVSDPDGAKDSTTVIYTVNAVNDAPVFLEIPEQIIENGGEFTVLDLATFVHDPDHEMKDITLSTSQPNELSVFLIDNLVTVVTPHSAWVGSESITFSATDASGAKGSIQVQFTVKEPLSVNDETPIPDAFALAQNYPNPFNPQTTIQFSLKTAGDVQVKIFDMTGAEVARLADGYLSAGVHKRTWQARHVASGTYILSIQVMNGGKTLFQERRKMLLLR